MIYHLFSDNQIFSKSIPTTLLQNVVDVEQTFLFYRRIQVIHETNIANSQHGKICLIPSSISEFNIQSIEFNSSIKIVKDRLLQENYGCKSFVKTKILKR